MSLLGQVKFPNDLPYAASRALGYSDDYLRGLEYYVVDGTAFFILKNTLRRELLNFKVRLPVVPKKFSNLLSAYWQKHTGIWDMDIRNLA